MGKAPVIVVGIALMSLGAGAAIARGGAQPATEEGGVSAGVRSQVDRMMARDADGDGVLSRGELPERLAERLLGADLDGGGTLTRDELEQYFAAQRGPGRGPVATQTGPAADDEVFEDAMKRASSAMRTLHGSGFGVATRDSDLGAAQTIQEAMVSAKASFGAVRMSPVAAVKYGNDAAAYRRDFRLAMVRSVRAALDLEEALLRDDAEGAKAALARLEEHENASHIEFRD